MKIDTKKRVITIQLRRLLTLIGILALLLAVILFGQLPKTFLGLNKYHWAILFAIIYGLTILYDSLFEYTYIYYDDEKDNIILRYFSLAYLNKKKQSIEIPKSEFTSFILKESLFGLKKKIILRRYYKNVEAKYPAIPLTILSKAEYAQLLMSLDHLSKNAKSKK
jgi:hypothetical protein